MTKEQWLDEVRLHQTNLRKLILAYHPVALAAGQRNPRMQITAHNAERSAAVVREKIAGESGDLDVLRAFDTALEDGNVEVINKLLNDAWFGVPESTSCWNILGFREAVDLMDDPPDELLYPPGEENVNVS